MTYAAGTRVSEERTKAEIERMLARYGCNQFQSGWDTSSQYAHIGFRHGTTMVMRRLGPLPGSARSHDSLVKACVELLTRLGIPAAAINRKTTQKRDGTWHAPGAPVGFPDVLACWPWRATVIRDAETPRPLCLNSRIYGRLVLVECKTGRSPVRPEQRETLDRWSRAGALCFVVRGVDELLAGLRAEGVVR